MKCKQPVMDSPASLWVIASDFAVQLYTNPPPIIRGSVRKHNFPSDTRDTGSDSLSAEREEISAN